MLTQNFLTGVCAVAVPKPEPGLQAELAWPIVIFGQIAAHMPREKLGE